MKQNNQEHALIESALRIALEAHAGQVDRHGQPYLLHIMRVGLRGMTASEQAAGFLHDVVEDTELTFDDLRARGIPQDVVDLVDHLTRRENESYEAYVERAIRHPVARRIKMRDLEDNMDLRRCADVTNEDTDRLARYVRAWRRITAMEAGKED